MKKNIIAIAIFIFIAVEVYYGFYKEEEKALPAITYIEESEVSLNAVLKTLENNKQINVIQINKASNGYIIEGEIQGKKEEFKKSLENLKGIEIINYSIELKGENTKGTFIMSVI